MLEGRNKQSHIWRGSKEIKIQMLSYICGNTLFVRFIPVLSKTWNKPVSACGRGLAFLPVVLDSSFSVWTYKIKLDIHHSFHLNKAKGEGWRKEYNHLQ